MNLPKMHKRVMPVKEASIEFGNKLSELMEKHDLHLDESILAYSQCIANLSSDNSIIHNEYQKDVWDKLEQVAEKYELTYGEKVQILISYMQMDTRYVIRWERHKDLTKEGDWE